MSTFALAVLAALAAAGPGSPNPFEAFARELELGLRAGREDALPFDRDALAERVTAGAPVPEKYRTAYVAGVKRGDPNLLGKQLADPGSPGAVKILRVSAGKGGEGRALLRVAGESGLRYFDLHLRRSGAGAVRIVDAFVFASGEDLSQTLRRLFLMVIAETDRGIFDRLIGKERELLAHVETMRRMTDARKEGRHADVLAAYDTLPAALKAERVFLLAQIAAASEIGEEKRWLRAIEDFEKALPGDSSLDLLSIDGFFMRKQYDRALASVDRLDARVGDPYLDYLRGSILLQKGDREGARRRFRAAIAREPQLDAPYWALAEMSREEGDFATMAALFTAVERESGEQIADLEEIPEYAVFVASKEYAAWKKRRGKKAR